MFLLFFDHHGGNRRKREDEIAQKLKNKPLNDLTEIFTYLDNEITRLQTELVTYPNDEQLKDDLNRTQHAKHHLQVALDRNLLQQKDAAVDALHNGIEVSE